MICLLGMGKTEVAELFAKMLSVSQVRADVYKSFTAAEALKMGSKQFEEEIKQLSSAKPKTGPSSAELPKGKYLVNEQVEVRYGTKWWPGKINELPMQDMPSLNADQIIPEKEYLVDIKFDDGYKIDKIRLSNIRRIAAKKRHGSCHSSLT